MISQKFRNAERRRPSCRPIATAPSQSRCTGANNPDIGYNRTPRYRPQRITAAL